MYYFGVILTQPAQLQRLARILELCIAQAYAFRLTKKKVADQTARTRKLVCAFVGRM